MKTLHLLSVLLVTLGGIAAPASAERAERIRDPVIERGRYMLIASGCNDCHTHGYMEADGNIPESAWLTGTDIGFQGPWGTTYPANLRLKAQELTEAEWLQRVRQPMRPPMPWFNLRQMTDADLTAIYRYLRAAGPAGKPAPDAAGPGIHVTTPYFDFTPKNLQQQQALRSRED